MANKYAQGNLFIVYFDSFGSRVDKELVDNYMVGRAKIDEFLSTNTDSSAILEKVVYNSKHSTNKWDL